VMSHVWVSSPSYYTQRLILSALKSVVAEMPQDGPSTSATINTLVTKVLQNLQTVREAVSANAYVVGRRSPTSLLRTPRYPDRYLYSLPHNHTLPRKHSTYGSHPTERSALHRPSQHSQACHHHAGCSHQFRWRCPLQKPRLGWSAWCTC
jgi:hypothetical protein